MPPDPKPEAVTPPENEFDRLRRLALEAEVRGEAIVMRDPKIPPPAAEETELVAVTEPIDDDDARMISTTDPAYWQLGALLKWFMKQPDHVLLSIAPQLMEALSVDDLEPDDEPGPAA